MGIMLETISLGIIGLFLGSFCAALSYRIANEVPIINTSRSFCDACKRNLTIIDLIPVLSFVLFKGKCRTCNGKISAFYPLAELTSMMVFASIGIFGHNMDIMQIAALCFVAFWLMVISFVDIKTMYVYDFCILFLAISCILYDWSNHFHYLSNIKHILYSILGGVIILLFKLGYEKIRSVISGYYIEVLGMGDVKIVAIMLFFLDFNILPIFTSLCGLIGLLLYGVNACFRGVSKSSDGHFPFAPSICLSFFVVLFVQ